MQEDLVVVQQIEQVTKEEFFQLIGADKNNAAAVTIWDTLQAHDWQIMKKGPKMIGTSFQYNTVDASGDMYLPHSITYKATT